MTSPLIIERACRLGNIDIIKSAPDNIKWNRRNEQNQSYIDIAIEYQQYDLVKELIKRGCKYESCIDPGCWLDEHDVALESILVNATDVSHEKRTNIRELSKKLALSKDITVNDIKKHVSKYGHITTLYKNLTVINELLVLYTSIEGRSNSVEFKHDYDIIEYLVLQCKVDVNIQTHSYTPLISICKRWANGEITLEQGKKLIKLLIDNGANINQTITSYHKSALHAVILNNKDTNTVDTADIKLAKINYLIHCGADPLKCNIVLEDFWADQMMIKWYFDNCLYIAERDKDTIYKVCEYGYALVYFYIIRSIYTEKGFEHGENPDLMLRSVFDFGSCDHESEYISIIDDLVQNRGATLNDNNYLNKAVNHQRFNVVKHLISKYKLTVSIDTVQLAICPKSLINSSNKYKIFTYLVQIYDIKEHAISLIEQLCGNFDPFFGSDKLMAKQNESICKSLIQKLDQSQYEKVYAVLCKSGIPNIHNLIFLLGKIVIPGLLSEICSVSFHYETYIKILETLLKNGADPNERINGEYPLHRMCRKSTVYIADIQLLINHGANVDAIDNDGHTPMYYVNDKDVIKLFKREGATKK